MIKNSIILIALIALLSSCNSKLPKPEPFLEHEEMVEFFTDLSLAEGARQFARPMQRHQDIEKLTIKDFYSIVFTKYNLTQEEFEAINNWYVNHPEEYNEILKESIDKLNILLGEEQKWHKEYNSKLLSKDTIK